MPGNIVTRFWSHVEKTETCWLWTASGGRGYGIFYPNGARSGRAAHRFAYELLVGPIPEGMQLDHLCRVRRCVNPAHLEPVTGFENRLRGTNAIARNILKTHCDHNHPFDEANTRHWKGERICRACSRERARTYRAQKAVA